MSWINQVKFFYTSTITLLATFIWAVITGLLFNQSINFQLFFAMIIMSNLGRYALRRGINPNGCLVITVAPIAVVQFLISSEPFYAVINIVFSCFLALKLIKEEKNNVNYDEYKRMFIHGVYYIFCASIIYSLMKWSGIRSSVSVIYIGILVYVILVVITLREAIGYEYQIKRTKESKAINYGLALFGILLTQEFVYKRLMLLAEMIKNWVGSLLTWLVDIILNVLKYPIAWFMSLLQRLIGDVDEGKFAEFLNGLNKLGPPDVEQLPQQGGSVNPIVFLVLKIIIAGLFIYFLYKAASKVSYFTKQKRSQEYTEEVESIELEKSKENKLYTKFKKLFRKKGTPRDEVIYKYGELVDTSAKKEIFKGYMTPSQLKYVIKLKVNSADENIDGITNIYNEAKFSTHDIEMSHQKFVEENVNKLNKNMK